MDEEVAVEGYGRCAVPPLMRLPLSRKQMAEEASKAAMANAKEKANVRDKCSGMSRKVVRDEREKRNKMAELYTKLRIMVPDVLPKEPRERIISGTISYIKDLEQCIKDLEAQKEKKIREEPAATSRTTEPRERIISGTISYIKDLEQCIKDLEAQKEKKIREEPAATSRTTVPLQTTRSSVNATLTGNTLFFGIQSAAIPGLASQILQVFETPNANTQVLASSTSCMERTLTVTVTAVIGDAGEAERTIEQLKADLQKCLP